MGCAFCETGKMGLIRNLSAKEIIAQVFIARHVLHLEFRNIVFMGMGEPFDNLDVVLSALRILTDPMGLSFGPSRITVSTSGHVEGIYRFLKEADPAINLAVSINAPSDAIRRRIMPVNARWDMGDLKTALVDYCAHPRREIFFEYVIMKGINDAEECADLLAVYIEGLKGKVNIIPYNPQSRDRFAPPEPKVIDAFLRRLRERGVRALVRNPKGQGIMAACGQLGNVQLRGRKHLQINSVAS
jgi:23S rRNA (adenine2503-C2)-methyltransferase